MGIEVREELCTGCGCCVLVCPEGAVEQGGGFVAEISEELCTECELCLEHCPTQALEINQERG